MSYDTIVVGAGSSGAVIASRLSENPNHSVLVIEAGPYYPTLKQTPEEIRRALPRDINLNSKLLGIASSHDWAFTGRATSKSNNIPIPRGKVVGGSSAVNSSIFLRGLPEDYDTWASMGNDEWTYTKILPYLLNIENDRDFESDFHNKGGPIPVTRFRKETWAVDQTSFHQACIAKGYPHCADLNAPNSTGVGPLPMNISSGVRWSTSLSYFQDESSKPNISIMSESLALRIAIKNSRAVGVEIQHKGEITTIYGEEIILSAGTISSPQLLLLSGIGAASELESVGASVIHDLPGVGKNLWDHPQVPVTFKTKKDLKVDNCSPRLQVGLKYTASGSNLRNDMMILPASFTSHAAFNNSSVPSEPNFSLIPCLFLQKSVGSLRLKSMEPDQQPLIDFNYLSDTFDQERLLEGVRICTELGSGSEMKKLVDRIISPSRDNLSSDNSLKNWMLHNVRTSHHAAGTCKMGPPSDTSSVVDQHGRVHGIKGLRVADASIMPSGVRANTHLTSVVIGERIVDFISHGF